MSATKSGGVVVNEACVLNFPLIDGCRDPWVLDGVVRLRVGGGNC